MVSGHVMAIYLKWYACSCNEPLVAQISICPNTFDRREYIETNHDTYMGLLVQNTIRFNCYRILHSISESIYISIIFINEITKGTIKDKISDNLINF